MLTVFLNLYPLHSVQNCSLAMAFTFGYLSSLDKVLFASSSVIPDPPSSELLFLFVNNAEL